MTIEELNKKFLGAVPPPFQGVRPEDINVEASDFQLTSKIEQSAPIVQAGSKNWALDGQTGKVKNQG